MKTIIAQLIDDFYERNLPPLTTRNKKTVQIQGKANVVIGMRRTGKTFFCYQKMQELIATGIPITNMLYLKIYTIDTGLLNAISYRNSANNGLLLENIVFMHLRRNG